MGKRIIEIDGMKVEIDLESAKRIDTFRVGDQVKVLRKKTNYSEPRVFPGIITSFDNFKDEPSITIAYYEDSGYMSTPNIKFLYYTKGEEEYEIVLASDDEIKISGDGVIENFEREIRKKENEISELKAKLAYFKKYFLKNDSDGERRKDEN